MKDGERKTIAIQKIVKILDKYKDSPSFRLAQLIYADVVDVLLEDERQIWVSLAYAQKPPKSRTH